MKTVWTLFVWDRPSLQSVRFVEYAVATLLHTTNVAR